MLRGSNRVYTMRMRGESNESDTGLSAESHSVLFCRFSTLSNSAEFCRILRNSAEIQDFRYSWTIGASIHHRVMNKKL